MKVILENSNTTNDATTKQFLCGPCSHYGGCN